MMRARKTTVRGRESSTWFQLPRERRRDLLNAIKNDPMVAGWDAPLPAGGWNGGASCILIFQRLLSTKGDAPWPERWKEDRRPPERRKKDRRRLKRHRIRGVSRWHQADKEWARFFERLPE